MSWPTHWSNPVAGAWREDEVVAMLPEAVKEARESQMRQARILVKVDVSGHHRTAGAASIEGFALRFGLGPRETRDLVRLGYLLRRCPEAEDAFVNGRLPLESAGWLYLILQPVGDSPPDARPAQGWLALACRTAPRDFGDLVRRVRAQLRTGSRTLSISLLLEEGTFEKFRRAKKVLRHMRKHAVSEDELVDVLCQEFLDRHDPARVPSRTRKVVPTDRRGRHIPAHVQREVIERDGLRCCHPGCERPGPCLASVDPFCEVCGLSYYGALDMADTVNLDPDRVAGL